MWAVERSEEFAPSVPNKKQDLLGDTSSGRGLQLDLVAELGKLREQALGFGVGRSRPPSTTRCRRTS